MRLAALLFPALLAGCTSPGATLGQPCVADSDCRFPLCIDQRCSASCDVDDHCLDEMRCERRTADGDTIEGACVPAIEGACEAASDCAADQACVAHVGAKTLDFACGDSHAMRLPLGSACDLDDDCFEGLCFDGRCSTACITDFDCISDLPLSCATELIGLDETSIERDLCVGPPTCRRDADCEGELRCTFFRGQDHVYTLCAESVGADGGEPCVSDHDCASALCRAGVCAVPCAGDQDCLEHQACRTQSVVVTNGADHAEICANTAGAECASDAACTLPDVCMAERTDSSVELTCGTVVFDGSAVGAPCNEDGDCRRNLCVEGACAQPCTDACVAEDILCRTTEIDLDVGSVLVDLCRPASPCASDGDCAAGDACVVGIWPTVDSTTVCLPRNTGDRPTGMPCTSDDQCQNNICIDTDSGRVCSEPCEEAEDCWLTEYACEPRPITGAPEEWAMVCVPPPPVTECGITPDCWETGGVCGDIRFGATTEAYCATPLPGGAALGESCTGSLSLNLTCRDRVCLTAVSSACSTPCATDADCTRIATGFACTDLPYATGARFCIETCADDSECGAPSHHCALSVNGTDDRYDFICRLPPGSMAVGTDCSTVKECDHGLCLRRTEDGTGTLIEELCTTPCTGDGDCPNDDSLWDWGCVDSTLARPVSGTAQVARVCSRAAK